jgi:hypothetical protein
MTEMPKIAIISASLIALILVVAMSGNTVSSDPQNGGFTFIVDGYTVSGVLTGAGIGHGGLMQMLMTIDQTIPITNGTVHVTGNGVWSGATNFQTLSGQITNVQGTVQICLNSVCQNPDFTGSGTWSGMITGSTTAGSQGEGTFQGTLVFSGSQINQTGPVPISGNWTASFPT